MEDEVINSTPIKSACVTYQKLKQINKLYEGEDETKATSHNNLKTVDKKKRQAINKSITIVNKEKVESTSIWCIMKVFLKKEKRKKEEVSQRMTNSLHTLLNLVRLAGGLHQMLYSFSSVYYICIDQDNLKVRLQSRI